MLVPEISLTPQTIQRFRGRCGEVAVLHSHLQRRRARQPLAAHRGGQVQVVVGARSAVFAPTRKLGPDRHRRGARKQLQAGIDAALSCPRRGRHAGPAGGHADHPRLGDAVAGKLAQRPARPVHAADACRSACSIGRCRRSRLIDLRHDRQPDGRLHGLSPTPGTGHAATPSSEGGQVMLLLNRRGFSTHVHCPACGHVEQCKFCDLALTYHRERDVVLCHYCGYEDEPPAEVPAVRPGGRCATRGSAPRSCRPRSRRSSPTTSSGAWTATPCSGPAAMARLLDAFRSGEIHILLGTQMIAKGLDFPNVTLVGVINADVGLHLPDFRAASGRFSCWPRWRAGPGAAHAAAWCWCRPIRRASQHHPGSRPRLRAVCQHELGHRREHNYPPYHRLARLIVRAASRRPRRNSPTLAGRFASCWKK